jgi:exonuclease III
MSLLSWNVAGRVKRLDEQIARVVDNGADIVCLQEVTPRTARRWRDGLTEAGWPHALLAASEPALDAGRSRVLQALTASRAPLSAVELPDLPWPERVVAAAIDGLELVNLHSPISPSPRLAKVLTHEAVHHHLAAGSGPRAVCGDLNTPRREHPDGRVWTFARTRHGKLRPERGERWDRAELALIKGLEASGFRDAFRVIHGLEVREVSWAWQTWGGGYRLDHLIVSSEVEVKQVEYLHEWRTEGLSDHAPLWATLAW